MGSLLAIWSHARIIDVSMHLSVIIPTYNRVDVLRRTLNLLTTQTLRRSEFEVIVVDDGSTDTTQELLAAVQQSGTLDLKYTHQKNSGQATARNTGIAMAHGKILVFDQDDMLPRPSFLTDHLRFHILHPQLFACALGRVVWHAEVPQNSFTHWLDTSGVQFKFHDLTRGHTTDYRRFYTSNISIKKEFLGEDRFDTEFHGWGWEDIELGYRLQLRGMRLYYWPEACVEHLHPMTDADLEERQYSSGKNAALFLRKHPEARILATGGKHLLQRTRAMLFPWTYWSRAKRAFHRGMQNAKR